MVFFIICENSVSLQRGQRCQNPSVPSAPSSLAGDDDQEQLPSPTYTGFSSAQRVHDCYDNFVWVSPKRKPRQFNFPTVVSANIRGGLCLKLKLLL